MFAYCKNCPVGNTDTRGNRPEWCLIICDGGSTSQPEPKDITKEFTELMRIHANQLVNHLFLSWMDYSDKYSIDEAYEKAFMDTRWFFAQQVKTNGEWDLKNGKVYPYYEEFVFNGPVVNGQDLGNIHYGFVGASVIPKESILHFFAGMYQIISGTKREYAFWYFDEPRDYDMIEYGFNLYYEDRYGYGG